MFGFKAAKLAVRIVISLLAGLTLICAAAGAVALGTGWDPRSLIPQLPRPQIDTGAFPVEALPQPGQPLPPQVGELIALPDDPNAIVTLEQAAPRRGLVAAVPAPQQMVPAPAVIGANFFLAILMALIFGVCSNVLSNLLVSEEARIDAWLNAFGLKRVVRFFQDAFSWTATQRVETRGGAGLASLGAALLILLLYGLIFALLERGTSLFSLSGLGLALQMALTVGLISLCGDLARRILARVWQVRSTFHLYPANLALALISVAASRLFVLTPGVVFGAPGGADLDLPPQEAAKREALVSLLTVALMFLLGGLAWVISGVILSLLGTPLNARAALAAGAALRPAQDMSLLLFLTALETLFFVLLPTVNTDGKAIFNWNKFVWVLCFVPVAFLFNHTLLNPTSGFLDSFQESNVRAMWVFLFGLAGFTGVAWVYFNVIDDILQEWVGLKRPRRSAGR